MGFVLLLAIFLTSTGFLVGAPRAPAPPAAMAPAPGSGEGRTLVLQLSPEFPGTKTPVPSAGSRATLTNVVSDERISGDARD
jgi:hypothetical protein